MQPVNYILQGADPVTEIQAGMTAGLQRQTQKQGMGLAANQDARAEDANARQAEMHPLAMEQAAANIESTRINQDATREAVLARRAAAQRTEQFRNAIADLGPDATYEDYAAVTGQFPEFAAGINETWKGLSDGRKAGIANRLTQIASAVKLGNLDLAQRLATEYADAADNSGDPASAATARAMAEIIKTDPEAAMASLGLTLSTVDPDRARALLGEGEKVQSSKIVGNGRISVQTMTDGSTRVVDMTTNARLTGDEAAQAIMEAEEAEAVASGAKSGAREQEKLDAQLRNGGQAEAAKALGKKQADFVTEALENAQRIRQNISTMNRARSAIANGGRTGVAYNLLPNVTKASAELANALDSMGLYVVGSVTFGALSEGELKLAMEVAAPRNLQGPELDVWLQDRIAAQEKVLAAVEEQAEFLADPANTLKDWTQLIKGESTAPEKVSFDPVSKGLIETATQADYDRVQEIGRRIRAGEKPTPEDLEFVQSVTR